MENNVYIFLGSFPGPENYEILEKKYFKNSISVSNSEYERVLFDGFKEQTNNCYFLSAVNAGKFPFSCKKPFVCIKNSGSIINCSYCTIVGILPISKRFSLLRKFNKLIKKNDMNNKKIFVIACEPHLPYLKILKYAKRKHCFTSLIVPDLPENNKRSSNKLYLFLKKYNTNAIYRIANNYSDSFLFFTEKLKDFFDVGNKPFLVKEGIIHSLHKNETVQNKIICSYIGKTDRENGLNIIVEAAKQMPDISFDIYGSGNMDEELKLLSIQNLHFFGFINPMEIGSALEKSTIFLSPRFPVAYTSVSFPSKVIKYLTYCKPIITLKLPCYSKKFDDCLIYMDDQTSESLQNAIRFTINNKNFNYFKIINKSLNDLFKNKYVSDFLDMLKKIK